MINTHTVKYKRRLLVRGRPLGILHTMQFGIPVCSAFGSSKLFRLYKALSASVSSVLQSITESEGMNAAEDSVPVFEDGYI